MNSLFHLRSLTALGVAAWTVSLTTLHAQGRQLTGPHAPSSQAPMPPETARQAFALPPGFEARLFAAEPDVVNPVAMTWDARGRLWVLELYEYPSGAETGERGRDRVKILEDTDADGRADSVTVFADGLNLATGLLLGNGGAYVGQAPHLLFLKDTDGDDRADERNVVKTGFGLEDRHELLNGFTWGPDGWLYMTHGVFTHSKVREVDDPEDDGVIMNAAVARYHPTTDVFEIFADGTSNPWGVDFDRYGNAFVSACVIDHLFHMAPGGLYVRQAGQPEFPYSYGLIPSIVDHKHYRAAYCGVQIYQGDQYPESYLGRILMGNIHANAVNMDRLEPRGASFIAHGEPDFVQASDGWFRPISEQIGPDGAVWIGDWYDKYPCYQNARADPEGVDRAYGRIWRIVYTGHQPGHAIPSRPKVDMDLSQRTTADLVATLKHPNVWHRETAQRLLTERADPASKRLLANQLEQAGSLEGRLASLWTLYTGGWIDEEILDWTATHDEFAVRAWSARITGERRRVEERPLRRLVELASDAHPAVRSAVATAARQHVSQRLTINEPWPDSHRLPDLGNIVAPLIEASAAEADPLIAFQIWMAAEPRIADEPEWALSWFLENGSRTKPLSEGLIYKCVRRICDSGQSDQIDTAVTFIDRIVDSDPALAHSAINGLLDGQKAKTLRPSSLPATFFARLLAQGNASDGLTSAALRLGALWGNQDARERILRAIASPPANATPSQTIQAIEIASEMESPRVREILTTALGTQRDSRVLAAVIEALGKVGDQQSAEQLVERWPQFPASAKRLATDMLASRPGWTPTLIDAIQDGQIAAADIPVTVIRTLNRHRDEAIRERARQVIGRFREPNANLERLIYNKKQVVLAGTPDIEAGRKVAETACLVCHKLHGKGAEVGPDLTGVGRSTLDALLANIINPNQIIGAGYENVEIETTDDRVVSGRLVEETETYVKIVSAGPREDVIAKDDIAERRVSELSVMPEGLEQLPDEDFRNMAWFLLNPPEDNRPMTQELRQELIGELPEGPPRDYEAIALWNPAWAVRSQEHQLAPSVIPNHRDKRHVLVTHPFWHQGAATLKREVTVPEGKTTTLEFDVAAADDGQWVLRVFAKRKLVMKTSVGESSRGWKHVEVDLTPFAGETIEVILENYAFDLENDFAYWHDIKITSS